MKFNNHEINYHQSALSASSKIYQRNFKWEIHANFIVSLYELQVTCNIIDVGRKFQAHVAIESYNLEIDSCSETFHRNLMERACLDVPGEIAVLSAIKVFIMIVMGHLRFSSHLRIFFSVPLGAYFSALFRGRAIYHTWNISATVCRLEMDWF